MHCLLRHGLGLRGRDACRGRGRGDLGRGGRGEVEDSHSACAVTSEEAASRKAVAKSVFMVPSDILSPPAPEERSLS